MTKPTCRCWIKRKYAINYYVSRLSPYYQWHGESDDKDTVWQFCPICGKPAEEVKP